MLPSNQGDIKNVLLTIVYSLFRSLIRSVCKAVVSIFCPLLVLLVFARNGQTVYDRLTKSVVVHVSHLYGPVYSNELHNINILFLYCILLTNQTLHACIQDHTFGVITNGYVPAHHLACLH